MRNFLGFAIAGLVIVLAAACPKSTQPGPCSASNCLGCCDSSGHCQRGVDRAACGFGGGSCTICNPTQACNGGQCGAPGPDSGPPGDAGCGLENCFGCCDSTGACQQGQSVISCGGFGQACQPCDAGFLCVPLDSDAGGHCDSPCNPNNCFFGCCAGARCVDPGSQSAASCGQSGQACISCDAGQTCLSGSCQVAFCAPGSCVGCCDFTGSCQTGTSPAVCGSGGNSCQTCPGADTCVNGQCVPPANVGDPCVFSNDCASLGNFNLCKNFTFNGTVAYPGGYCTLDCSGDAGACPAGSTCANMGGLFGETNTICIAGCAGLPNQCREPGYACYVLANGLPPPTGCWIDPPAPNGLEGAPCTSSGACTTSTGPGQGFCVSAALPDGGPTGFVGGMCSADCRGWASVGEGDIYCGSGGTCVANDGGSASCFQNCPAPLAGQSSCRSGYVCRPAPGAVDGFCYPNCSNAGIHCPAGTACSANGYCCDGGTCS